MSTKKIVFFVLSIAFLMGFTYILWETTITGSYMLKKENAPFEVDQILLKILIKVNESMTKSIRIMNIGETPQKITIESSLDDILVLSEKEFLIKPGQTKTIDLIFSSTNEEKKLQYNPGVYVGKLSVISGKFVEEIPVIVEIESKHLLFDMNLNIPATDRKVLQGSDVTVEVRLFNLEGTEPTSVNMEYFVKDLNGNNIITESETVVIETQASFFKTLSVPKNLRTGSYVFAAKTEYGSSVGTSSYLFEVIRTEEPRIEWVNFFYSLTPYILLSFVVLALGSFSYKIYIRRKKAEKIPKAARGLWSRVKKIENKIERLKGKKIDTRELEVEAELAVEKVKGGMLKMATEYVSSLEKKLEHFERGGGMNE